MISLRNGQDPYRVTRDERGVVRGRRRVRTVRMVKYIRLGFPEINIKSL